MAPHTPVRLLLADVDGTLVTHDKLLTPRAVKAVRAARQCGIAFAITSGRPPRGMQMLFEPLDITTPIAGFNGGMIVRRDLSIIKARTLPDDTATTISSFLASRKLDVWIYTGNAWFVTNATAPHVAREAATVQFAPTVTDTLQSTMHDVVKIVGVSDDLELVKSAEVDAQRQFGRGATVARSQPYYLDITHCEANKGAVLRYLADTLHLQEGQIATIGDQPNDVLMFHRSGYSVAMGNASDEVKQQATTTTQDSEHDGFAQAVERIIAQQAA